MNKTNPSMKIATMCVPNFRIYKQSHKNYHHGKKTTLKISGLLNHFKKRNARNVIHLHNKKETLPFSPNTPVTALLQCRMSELKP